MCVYIKCFKKLENDPFVYHVHSILFVSHFGGEGDGLSKKLLCCTFYLQKTTTAVFALNTGGFFLWQP